MTDTPRCPRRCRYRRTLSQAIQGDRREIEQQKAEIKDKASYFVADLLSDGVVTNEEEIPFLLAIIESATFHIAQIVEKKEEEAYD